MALPEISTMPTPFLITKKDQELAKSIIETIRSESGETSGVAAILNAVAEGHNVIALSEMSPDEAAAYLDIPEDDLMQLINSHVVESRRTGDGFMVSIDCLERYKRELKRLQREGLDALTQQAQELGLYDD